MCLLSGLMCLRVLSAIYVCGDVCFLCVRVGVAVFVCDQTLAVRSV